MGLGDLVFSGTNLRYGLYSDIPQATLGAIYVCTDGDGETIPYLLICKADGVWINPTPSLTSMAVITVGSGTDKTIASDITEVSQYSGSNIWKVQKSFTVGSITGLTNITGFTAVFDERSAATNARDYRVCVNGVAVYTSGTVNNNSYVTRTHAITNPVAVGDIITFEQRNTGGSDWLEYMKNAYIKVGAVAFQPNYSIVFS